MSVSKRVVYGVLAVLAVVLAALYAFVRPMAVSRLEPLLREAAGERLLGTLSWRALDLDAAFDLD